MKCEKSYVNTDNKGVIKNGYRNFSKNYVF